MKYTTASAFRAALEQRLVTMAQQRNTSLMRLRKLVVFDRLMARLLIVARGRWVLKGALALDLRWHGRFRTTKDMDLARGDGEEAATTDLLAAQSVDLGDYFTFSIEKTNKLDTAFEGAAVRFHVRAELAGRPFEEVIVDVGFGDPLVSSPELVQGSDLLSFAGIDPIEIPVLPLEQHVADKVHAYTRTYATGQPSSRVKDLIDLALIQSCAAFEAGRLRNALQKTFGNRATHPLPAMLPYPPPDWGPAYRKMAITLDLFPDVAVGHQLAARFLDPVLDGTASDDARWDPSGGTWQPPLPRHGPSVVIP